MARKLKVYGWIGHRVCGQTREICAAHSVAELLRIITVTMGPGHRPGRDYICETGNDNALATALAEPGTIFWCPLDERPAIYRRFPEKKED